MNTLARIDLPKLTKICGMFGSIHDGERAAAAARADRMVRDVGMTWADVINPRDIGMNHDDLRRRCAPSAGEILASHSHGLTDWERQFLVTIIRWPSMSPRQREIFAGLQARFAR